MRAFNLTVPSRFPSVANAIQAGSIGSHGGTPIAGAGQRNSTAVIHPVANPVRVTGSIGGSGSNVTPKFPRTPFANPLGPVSGINGSQQYTISAPIGLHPIGAPVHAFPIRGAIE